MVSPGVRIRILLIRPWVRPLEALRDALRAVGVEPRFTRVDIEPALNASLTRGGLDLAILDPETPGLSRDVVEARFREHGVSAPLLDFDDDLAALAQRVRSVFPSLRN